MIPTNSGGTGVTLSARTLILAMLLLVGAGGQGQTPADPRPPTNASPAGPDASLSQRGSDPQLANAIRQRLLSDQHVTAHRLRVAVTNRTATLSGEVNNLLAKERAADLAATISGIRGVQNEIQLSVPLIEEGEMLAQVRSVLLNDPAAESYRLQTEATNGIVVVSGVVTSRHRKYLAEALIKTVPGVVQVENEISLDLVGQRADEEIRADVLSAIRWDPWLKDPQLKVKVKDGNVTISGVVSSQMAKRSLVQDVTVAEVKSLNLSAVEIVPGLLLGTGGSLQPETGTPSPTGRKSPGSRGK